MFPRYTAKISEHRYAIFLICAVLMLFISPFFIGTAIGGWAVTVTSSLITIAIVFTVLEDNYLFILACAFAFIIIVLNFMQELYPSRFILILDDLLSICFYIFAIVVIFSQILTTRAVTVNILFGSLCIYILIAVSYGNAYFIIELLNPGSFRIDEPLKANHQLLHFHMNYFSFTTLTTVGFGDIVPNHIYAKSLVILEQTTGVLYLAALVSRLVAGLRQ